MTLEKNDVLTAVRAAPPAGLKLAELATLMNLDSKDRHRLRRLMEELLAACEVERADGARYRVPGAAEAAAAASAAPREGARVVVPPDDDDRRAGRGRAVGRIRVHPAGYGFVEREDGEVDVFVPARFRGPALDGDKVRLSTWVGYKGVEGRVEEVLERGRAKLTGIVRSEVHNVFLEPDDPRIASAYGRVALENGSAARPGMCVVAEITRYPTGPGDAAAITARVVHVLGPPDDPRTEVAKVIACAEIPDQFPDDAIAAAQRTPRELRAADFADRIDLRDRPFLTIDPETARDFDDAICVEERGSGFRLWIAVADVSHYVTQGSALDREARIRGCSVYLPDRAIPMLPKELSAGICSLNPEVDRCAMVVRIDVDGQGVPVDGGTSFAAAVIRSHARLDYPGVAAALAGDFRGPRARYQDWLADLKRMHELSRKMRKIRLDRGALDFDLPEARVILDEDDPTLVRDVRRSKASAEVKQAYQLVEEYMLAANEAVARFFRERGADTMWRVHDKPSQSRLEEFAELARSYGIDFDAEEAQDPRVLKGVLASVAGQPYEKAVNYLLLRSMKQAQYDIVPIGHFGLASSDYLHFTSPIRRYPDLIVHRLMKYYLRREGLPSGGSAHPNPPDRPVLAAMSAEASSHERRAAEAEREVVDMYRAYLMRDRVGEELEGTVSGVTNFGVFVEITEPFVEGMIKLDALGDESWEHDDKHMRLIGRRTGRVIRLGDAVKVRIENVSVARRRIDLSLVEGGVIEAVPVVIGRGRGAGPAAARAARAERPFGAGQKDRRRRNQERDRQQRGKRDEWQERGGRGGGGGGGGPKSGGGGLKSGGRGHGGGGPKGGGGKRRGR
jgi:ribonuclease R